MIDDQNVRPLPDCKSPVKLDLSRFFNGAEDYVILRLSEEFPNYTDASDVDLLCANIVAILRRIMTIGSAYETQGIKICVQAIQRQLHVDFYSSLTDRLVFRFDLIDSLDTYNQFAVSINYAADILARKRKLVRNGLEIYVPDPDDDLALRFLEYLKHKDERPSKVKHLEFIKKANRPSFLQRVEQYTGLSVSLVSASNNFEFNLAKKLSGSTVPPKESTGAPSDPFYCLSSTCQIPRLAWYFEQFFSYRANGCFVEVGAFDGEYVSNTSGLADLGWTGHYIEPVPQYARKCRARHARNTNVTVSDCAIGAVRGRVRLHLGGPLSTTNAAMKELFETLDWAKGSFAAGETVEIEQYNLNEFLVGEKRSPGFELLVIDVEGSEWGVLQGFDINHWQPEMVIIELHDQNHEYDLIHAQCKMIVRYFEDHGYVPVYKDATNTIYFSRNKLLARSERMDYFLIWGHGLPFTEEILERIRRRRDLKILSIHKKKIQDLSQFVQKLYACDTVPYDHLREKTRYLQTVPGEIVFIVVRNLNTQEHLYGDGPFRHSQCALIKDVKEEVRNDFNPRTGGKRSEDHVIHASDYESQVEHALQLLGLPPIAFYRRKPHPDFDLPYHLEPFECYQLVEIPLESIRACILGKGVVPLEQTPHYQYVTGDKEPYIQYHRRHFGLQMTDDHLPANFDRLIREFDIERVRRGGNHSPLVVTRQGKTCVIQDGVHRAAILKHLGVPTVRVLEILPQGARQSFALPLSVIVSSKDRALQLDATLRTFRWHCREAASVCINILYTTSNAYHQSQYETLMKEHPAVRFVREQHFKTDVLNLMTGAAYVLFVVDDCLFVRGFRLREVLEQLECLSDAIGFSLRLGRNTAYCYPYDQPQLLPEFEPVVSQVLRYAWSGADYDFGYPLEVSSSVYRSADLLALLQEKDFNNPNTLEAVMADQAIRYVSQRPRLLCFEQSVAFCAPLNKVQNDYPNRSGKSADMSVEHLARLYAQGFRMDVASYDGFVPNGCHQEVELRLLAGPAGESSEGLSDSPSQNLSGRTHRVQCRTVPPVQAHSREQTLREEVAFWDEYLRTRGGQRWAQEFEFRLRPDSELQDDIAQSLDISPGGTLSILDVGSGPLSYLGKRWPGRTVCLTAVAPLAAHYNELLKKYCINPPVPTQLAAAERLVIHFPLNHFDVVYARNSIDHSCDAPQAVDQMFAVARPGGCVLLEHGLCKGAAQNYAGLHTWNFLMQNGEFVIEDSNGKRVNMTQHFAGIGEVSCTISSERNWISVRINKLVPTVLENLWPLVSVVIPCYNQAKYLPGAVESVVQQTFQNFEIIIVSDGSPDDTQAVFQHLAARWPQCPMHFLQKPNGGLADARNAGIAIARGQYILPLDADDKLHPEMLAKTVAVLESRPDTAIVYTDLIQFGAINGLVQAAEFDIVKLYQNNQLNYCSLFRREVWEAVGGYNLNMVWGYEDWDFWIGCAEKGYMAQRLPEALLFYRVKRESMFTKALEHDAELKAQIVLNHPSSYSKQDQARAHEFLRTLPTPLVSVIIPTYNRPDTLRKAIQSIINQTIQNFEIIVVNDAGVDVEHVVKSFHSVKISLISHANNKGLAAARNTGIRAARGKYISYLDDDDIYYPTHLETLVEFLKIADEKVAYTDAHRAHKKSGDGRYVTVFKDVPYSCDFDPVRLLYENYIPVLCVMHERACISEVGLFDETLRAHEDWDLWMRMSRNYTFKHIKKTTCEFSWREDKTSLTFHQDMATTRAIVGKRGRKYLEQVQKDNSANTHLKSSTSGATNSLQANSAVVIPLEGPKKKCSIIIPVFNKVEYTKRCMEAIQKNTLEGLFEVIFVDNGSTDGSPGYLKSLGGQVTVITNSMNLGFVSACNQGARVAATEYLVFLNNDTEPQQGWLENMISTADSDTKVGAVGAKLIYPDGRIQEAGGIIFSDGRGWNFGNGDDAGKDIYNRLCEVDYCSGACLLVRREQFLQLGGMDERYSPAYYEETDLCFSLRKSGFKVVYNPKAVVIHHESITAGTGETSFKRYLEVNRQRFVSKWKRELASQPLPPILKTTPPTTADRNQRGEDRRQSLRNDAILSSGSEEPARSELFNRVRPEARRAVQQDLKALVFFPHNPYPARTGAHQRCLAMLKGLRDMGSDVVLYSSTLFSETAWTSQGIESLQRDFGIDVHIHQAMAEDRFAFEKAGACSESVDWRRYAPPGIQEDFLRVFRRFNPQIVMINYAFWGGLTRSDEFLKALKIIDVHDLVSLNMKLRDRLIAAFAKKPMDPSILDEDFFSGIALSASQEEYHIYNWYDHTIAISESEAQKINSSTARTRVSCIPMTFEPVYLNHAYAGDPLYVIGDNPFNLQGYLYFVSRILPGLRRQFPEFTLRVAGYGSRSLPPAKGVRIMGPIPDLRSLYSEASFAICPLIGGTGQQVKIVEAMAHGLPVVALRNVAVDSPIEDGVNGFVVENASSFSLRVGHLYEKRESCREMGRRAQETIRQGFSENALRVKLNHIIRDAFERKPERSLQAISLRGTPQALAGIPDRILWMRTDSIGDNVIASAMLEYIRKRYPDSTLSVLCQDRVAELYAHCPYTDCVVGFNRARFINDTAYRNEIFQAINVAAPSWVLNTVFSRDPVSDLLVAGVHSREKVGHFGDLSNISQKIKSENDGFYTRLVPQPNGIENEIERNRRFLREIGINANSMKPVVWTNAADGAFAEALFDRHGLQPGKTIALFGGAQHESRFCYQIGSALKNLCLDRGLRVIALGGAADQKVNRHNLQGTGVLGIDLTGQTTLRQAAAIIRRCALSLGTETGLAHISCAVGTPNLTVVGGGHFGRFMPYSDSSSIVCLPLDCYGCNWNCRHKIPYCIRGVKPDVLEKAVVHALDRKSSRPRVWLQAASAWDSHRLGITWKDCLYLLNPEQVEVGVLE